MHLVASLPFALVSHHRLAPSGTLRGGRMAREIRVTKPLRKKLLSSSCTVVNGMNGIEKLRHGT